jgi:hypothetical protein
MSKLITVGTRRLELAHRDVQRVESLQLGKPDGDLNAGTFGRIYQPVCDPRIMQFGVKYDF